MRVSLIAGCAIALLLTATAAACGGSGGSGSSGVTVTTTVTETATETGGSTGDTGSAAPCAASDLLPVLKAQMDGTADKLTIVKVKVTRCQNDYAFVIAVPDQTVCNEGVGDCYDSAQVLMSWDGSQWNIIDTGSDIGCTSIPLSDQTLVACKALGYPIVTTTTFKMPSGNIGCALLGASVRCDIRSGLKPPPAKSCAGDWIGAVLAATGAAKPLCATDTIYDASAPVLDYGSTWGGGGVTCLSDASGLECSSASGHSFFLSRDSWSAS
ncbi:MAG: DUF6636 domain-containing protein [Gaiellales bacterium]